MFFTSSDTGHLPDSLENKETREGGNREVETGEKIVLLRILEKTEGKLIISINLNEDNTLVVQTKLVTDTMKGIEIVLTWVTKGANIMMRS